MKKREGGGFTLIELLVVIAVLGILMAGIVIAINPAEKMAQARDASRKSSVGQIGTALAAYYTSKSATYPTVPEWNAVTNALVTSGDLKSFPPQVGAVTNNCGTDPVNGYCYAVDATPITEVITFAKMESKSEKSKCPVAGNSLYWTYSTRLGKACGWCGAADPTEAGVTAANCIY